MKNILLPLVTTTLLLTACGAERPAETQDTARKTAYQRVIESGTLRCGYTSWEPLFYINMTSGEKSGIFHDMIEEVGKRLDIKIVWQEELGWGSAVTAINAGRVDMACAGYWLNAGRIKSLQSTTPQLFSPMHIYMRADDTRHITHMEQLNHPDYTLTVVDGSAENNILAARFPNSTKVTLTELNSSADTIQNLLTKKADFLILDIATAHSFEKTNPGKIKQVLSDSPAGMFPTVMLFSPEDIALKNMIDNTLLDIEYDGTLDKILKKYDTQHLFLRNQLPSAMK